MNDKWISYHNDRYRKNPMNHSAPDLTAKQSSQSLIASIVGFLAFLYVFSTYTTNYLPEWSRLTLILAFPLAIAVCFQALAERKKIPWIVLLPWVFYVFLLYTSTWAEDEDLAFRGITQTFSAFLGGTAIWQARNQGLSWKLVVWAMLSGSLILILSARGEVQESGAVGRASGLAGNANQFAICLAYTAVLTWCAFCKMPRWMHVVGVFLCAYTFFFSGSRKTLVILAFVAIALIFKSMAKIRKASTWVIMGGVGLSGLLGIYYLESRHPDWVENLSSVSTVHRALKFLPGSKQGVEESTRVSLIEEGLDVWGKNPLVGVGPDQMQVVSGTGSYAHNDFIEILADYGVVGFVLYYSMYAVLLTKAAYHGIHSSSGSHRRAFLFLSMSLTLNMAMVTYSAKVPWIFFAMAASLVTGEEAERQLLQSSTNPRRKSFSRYRFPLYRKSAPP